MKLRGILLCILALCLVLSACGGGGTSTDGDYSFSEQSSSKDYGNLEAAQITYMKQWERVIENDELEVKLYKPYRASEVFNNHPVWSSSQILRANRYNAEQLPLPTPAWYDNARIAKEFLRRYNLEFVAADVAENNLNALILNFYSGGDDRNILVLDVMIIPDGTVYIRNRECDCVLRATEKIVFQQFSSLDFQETAGPVSEVFERWAKVIYGNLWMKLYPAHTIESEVIMSTLPSAQTPTWEWYDSAQKAITFFRGYNLEFVRNTFESSQIIGVPKDSLVLIFFSGGNKENIEELRVIVTPDGMVILDDAELEKMCYARTKIDVAALKRAVAQKTTPDYEK